MIKSGNIRPFLIMILQYWLFKKYIYIKLYVNIFCTQYLDKQNTREQYIKEKTISKLCTNQKLSIFLPLTTKPVP